MKKGIELITEEREEQTNKHNRTLDHDLKTNDAHQLAYAASELITHRDFDYLSDLELLEITPFDWDENQFLKMCRKSYRERLVIAGALIAAEIDRLQAL